MAKILPATCEAGIVTIESHVITPATILSEGVKSSSGIAIIDEEKVSYVTSNSSDIKDLIESLCSILTAIDAVTVAPGGSTAAIAQLLASKENLK